MVCRAQLDGGEHGGEDFVAVVERRDLVAIDERRAEELAQGTLELRVAHAVGQFDGVADLFFVGDEVARELRADRTGGEARAESRVKGAGTRRSGRDG